MVKNGGIRHFYPKLTPIHHYNICVSKSFCKSALPSRSPSYRGRYIVFSHNIVHRGYFLNSFPSQSGIASLVANLYVNNYGTSLDFDSYYHGGGGKGHWVNHLPIFAMAHGT